jgi:hypothetical protein
MQKDVHFYLTYALARIAGIKAQEAKEIAWADQYTDDLTEAQLYGIQTQCEKLGNWSDRQIQLSVLIPFHFIPGGTPKSKWPWMVTENNARAKALVKAALAQDAVLKPFSLGISLHGLQDTFSHQGFSGWEEKKNSCYPWYYLKSALPNVGHTEMLVVPDIVDRKWVDPRTNKEVNNQQRALRAARETFHVLAKHAGLPQPATEWTKKKLGKKLSSIFREGNYDKRKKKLLTLAGNPQSRYSKISKSLGKKHGVAFMRAATQHLSKAIGTCADLQH